MRHAQERLARATLYLVCDDKPRWFLDAALRGGVDVVQLRMKDTPDELILRAARRFAAECADRGALFILNDRPELVGEAGANGVHLGQEDGSVGRARELLGPEQVIGVSTHTPAQIDAAIASGADYIGVGPVYRTPTKPGRPAVGTELVRYAAAHATVPFFAIGGIDAASAPVVVSAGAQRIAVVRAIAEAPDPERAARTLKVALGGGETPVGQEAAVGSA